MPRVSIGIIAVRRAIISLAALFVKVTARMVVGDANPCWISQAIRVMSTRVLPLPAPARISAGSFGSVTAASCSGFRLASRSGMGEFSGGTGIINRRGGGRWHLGFGQAHSLRLPGIRPDHPNRPPPPAAARRRPPPNRTRVRMKNLPADPPLSTPYNSPTPLLLRIFRQIPPHE